MQTSVGAPPAPKKMPRITCTSDCGVSGHLIYPTLWVWPALGIVLALVIFTVRLRRKRGCR